MSPSPEPAESFSHGPAGEAIDPDVDLHVPAQRAETAGVHLLLVLAAVSAGGAAGAIARYAVGRAWPVDHAADGAAAFPWGTFGINVVGSALIGVLMVLVSEGGRTAHPLVRPFFGVGVLGGFTTFSAYALDFRELLVHGNGGVAYAYAGGTAVGCLGAVWLAAALTRWALAPRTAVR